jgi:hypothetical protein
VPGLKFPPSKKSGNHENSWRLECLSQTGGKLMTLEEFNASTIDDEAPAPGLSIPLAALWWDAKGDWTRAHSLVDELESVEGMAVHAYLHRQEGSATNAKYWYERSGRKFYRPTLDAERRALIQALLAELPDNRKA